MRTRLNNSASRLVWAGSAAALVALLPASAYAQEAGDDGSEIVVTAQKRAQALSDVSLSVSAVGAEQLSNSNTVSLYYSNNWLH